MTAFYQKYSRQLLWLLAITFPILHIESNSMPSNNDIETWLPNEHSVREDYDRFKLDFGNEEMIVVGLDAETEQTGLAGAIATRLESLDGIRSCWAPEHLAAAMQELEVSPETIDHRLTGLCRSHDGKLISLMAILSPEGLADRGKLVEDVKSELAYCQLEESDWTLAGAPVVVTELDRLGNKEESGRFFYLTLLISLILLYRTLRHWKLTLVLLGQTLWAISLSGACIKWAGGEANFILGALSIMVMVFTLAASIHVVHYYQQATGDDRLGEALRLAWKPCLLAMLTTAIGLASLMVSDMMPVKQFGFGAAMGAVVSLIVGFGVTPAALVCWPLKREHHSAYEQWLPRFGFWIVANSRKVVATTVLLIGVCSYGLFHLHSKISPLEFLPPASKVRQDVVVLEENFASCASIETVVDFGGLDLPFAEKLRQVQELCQTIESHPSIEYAISAATFLPERLPGDAFEAAALLSKAQSRQGESDFLAEGDRLWRISARFSENVTQADRDTIAELKLMTAGTVPIEFTGMEVLLEHAQYQIFAGFWESFATAFLIITCVMIVSLRSISAGLIAMIPNLTPVCLIFGLLGWFDIPVEIGTMMTGSIALGLAVDGTFHYLVRYHEACRRGDRSARAARKALLMTGGAIFNASIITACGMLALGLSSFAPTARFGMMMTALMLAAIVGDLILLPALLSLKPENRKARRAKMKLAGPHAPMHAPSEDRRVARLKAS